MIIALIIATISTTNKFKKMLIKIEEANSGIDVALAKRYDILTKMIEVVKGYMKHEKEILFTVTEIREGMSINEKLKANNAMDENYNKIFVLSEEYPNLKSNENFKILQKSIIEVEEHLQAARRMYNANVSIYNQAIYTFPKNIIAAIKCLKPQKFFEVTEEQRNNINPEL